MEDHPRQRGINPPLCRAPTVTRKTPSRDLRSTHFCSLGRHGVNCPRGRLRVYALSLMPRAYASSITHA